MKASHPSIGWPFDKSSSRSAVRVKRAAGSGSRIGSGALTPPVALPIQPPFGAVSPCLMSGEGRWRADPHPTDFVGHLLPEGEGEGRRRFLPLPLGIRVGGIARS